MHSQIPTDEEFTKEMLSKNPLLDLRLASENVGLIVFTGGVASGKRKAARIALGMHERAGGKFMDLEHVARDLTPEQLMAIRRVSGYVYYFGEIVDADTWDLALDFVSNGHGVIACLHAINDEGLAEELEQIGLPCVTAIERIKRALARAACFSDVSAEEARLEANRWVDYLIRSNSFLEVRMGESPQACLASDKLPLIH
jgi:hypothetical protein